VAGLASAWDSALTLPKPALEIWTRAAAFTPAVALTFSGLGFVRIPLRPIPDDAYRYVRDIETQFQGLPASRSYWISEPGPMSKRKPSWAIEPLASATAATPALGISPAF
jgi:hypothetical protein